MKDQKKPRVVQPTSRCAQCLIEASRAATPLSDHMSKRIEGVYVTVDMRSNEVLHLAEMLNAEGSEVKQGAAAVVSSHVTVGTMCADCGCNMWQVFEGKYLLCELLIHQT